MIKATFKKLNDSFIEYEVTGHAHYAESGKDIICAGVSTLFITITNQLLCKSYVKLHNQRVSILNPNEIDNALVEALLCGLYDIQQNYSDHVLVEVVEVGNMIDANKVTVGTINLGYD
ncbi:ribosomal-processing cysteine protease Prp [Enterococcus malodoratus]|uniref:ribosomal-processing cysteine protease Prp n=1 Tax=Enterococcus malodoratus TaxID=71451 RepID=UPI003FD1DBC5